MIYLQNPSEVIEIIDKYPPEVILFLGAGASRSFGMPIMKEFLDEYFGRRLTWDLLEELANVIDSKDDNLLAQCMIHLLNNEGIYRRDEFPIVDLEDIMNFMGKKKRDLLSSIRSHSDKELLDAYSIALTSRFGPKFVGESTSRSYSEIWQDYIKKIDPIIKKITIKIYETYGGYKREPDFISYVVNTYEKLFHLLIKEKKIQGNIAVFTTNYDPCFDIFIDNKEKLYLRNVINGFPQENEEEKVFNFKNFIVEIKWATVISIFNLHGSVLWVKKDGKIIKRDVKDILNIDDFNQATIVPPYIYKEKEKPFTDFYDIYGRFCMNDELKYYISIGFSFRDEELRTRTMQNLKHNDAEIIINNPDYDEISRLFSKEGKTIKAIRSEFPSIEFFSDLSGVIQNNP